MRLNSVKPWIRPVILTLIGTMVAVFPGASAQNTKSKPSQDKKAPEPVAQRGYLRTSPPGGLRFAPPPKPPVTALPPLPITYDPQPVFTHDFAQPLADFPVPPAPVPVRTNAPPNQINITDLATVLTNKQGKIPAAPPTVEAVTPLMLIKFFQDTKPNEVQMVLPDPVYFRAPVRDDRPSSSARYQVK